MFLPRPLLVVDHLPLNASVKLSQQALRQLIPNMQSILSIPADHASFAGHFPQFPLLPGAVLLDAALDAVMRARGLDLLRWRITSAKFLNTVRPGDELCLRHETPREGLICFTIRSADRTVASGTLAQLAPDGSA